MGPVDYNTAETPDGYACVTCSAMGVKLWRQYETFLDEIDLRCVNCAAQDQGKNALSVDADGTHYERERGHTYNIGNLVPAIPDEEGSTYWGYTSVPQAGVDWWQRLPNKKP